tara:strand:- start:433 stop:831 length:399 start_codon:yes stop_codon:yes gene_type:complete
MAYESQKYGRPGLGSVGQYQMSAVPFATASLFIPAIAASGSLVISFPTVTKFITVVNEQTGTNAPLRFGFSALGVEANACYVNLNNGESYTGEWRVKSLYLAGAEENTTGSVYAGLTSISASLIYTASAGIG